uniref:Lipase n=1 Tax=Syphacia muris TaxID=451379 RepID=A0A0N5ATW7_9BILA
MLLCSILSLLLSYRLCNDEEIGMKTPQIISYWKYPVETIPVVTADGYILNMHRIPFGRKNSTNGFRKRPVVFLQHGLESSSSNFVTMLPHKALGFLLADAGFDVWMGNSRGNLYSTGHTVLNVNERQYWQFSWEEMAKYDLTAMIEKALEITNQSSLYYVGHSQGTIILFTKLASEPEFACKIKKFFALAPVGTVKHLKGMLGVLARKFYYVFEFMEHFLGKKRFLPNTKLTTEIKKIVCTNSVTERICDNLLFLIAGPESNQLNITRLPVYLTDIPSGTSTKNIQHWAQMARSQRLQSFDYGEKNFQHYGQKTPPVYNLSNVNVDTYLYYGDKDWLADEADVEEFLIPSLNPKIVKSIKHLIDYDHFDFIWGERSPKEIYESIINILLAES